MSGEVSGFVVWVAHYVATMCLNNLNLTGAVKIFRCAKVIGLWVCGSTIYFTQENDHIFTRFKTQQV